MCTSTAPSKAPQRSWKAKVAALVTPLPASYELDAAHQHLWRIHGQYYDLSDFIHRHPGGSDQLEIGRGRECSAFFESNHPFSDRPRRILQKFRVNEVDGEEKKEDEPTTSSTTDHPDPFYQALSQRVAQALRAHGVDPVKGRGADTGRWFYYLFVVVGLLTSMVAHWKGSLVGSFFVGIFAWHTFSMGHDAAHWTVSSKNQTINRIAQWPYACLIPAFGYGESHSFAHHCFTNDHINDPDTIVLDPFLRLHPNSDVFFFSSFQKHIIYPVIVYACFGFLAIVAGMPQQLLRLAQNKRERFLWKTTMVVGNLLQVFLMWTFHVVRPFVVHSDSWTKTLLAIWLPFSARGLYMALMARPSHQTEKCMFRPLPDKVKDSWAAMEIKNSNSYCVDSLFWRFVSNHINLQIEHHLFPGVNECHLHLMTPAIKQVCAEWGVEPNYYDSFWELLRDHFRYLTRVAPKTM